MSIPGGWELILILGVLVLLFGAKRLPDMARSVGQSARVFKGEMKGLRSDEEKAKAAAEKQAEPHAALPAIETPQPSPAQPASAQPEAQHQNSTGQ